MSTPPELADAIVESAMDAVVAVDEAQRIVLFNRAAERMFGCPAAGAIGQPLDRFLPDRFRGMHRRHLAGFTATGGTARAMGHLRPLAALRADGTEFPIEASISRVAVGDGLRLAAIIRDVSVRHALEEALRRQANLLDLAYDAIFTWEWGGAITFWNRGAERLYGYAPEDAVGQVSDSLLRTRHPRGRSAMIAALERDGAWEGELVHVRRDGAEVTVESRHVLVREGDRAYVLEATHDVTARRRAEAERTAMMEREVIARTERDRLQEILDGLPSGVYIVADPDGRIEFANAAFTELISRRGEQQVEDMPAYGKHYFFRQMDGSALLGTDRPGQRALRGDRVRNQQLELERADGTRVPISVHAAPLRGGNPDSTGATHAIVVVQDVTQLREAEQFKDDFLALISHELRTPLTVVHGGAHLLADASARLDDATRTELLVDVVAESDRLERMLGNILTLANVMAGRLRVGTEPVLIRPLAVRVAAEVAGRSPRHTFTVEVPSDLPPAEADPALLEEVLRNLYENAVKYAPNGGTVRTSAQHTVDAITIRVTDEGVGIAPEHTATVFERFRRVGGDPSIRGMGLGLYLCRALVEAQGGSISASSPGPDQGTSISVTLPLAGGWADQGQRSVQLSAAG